MERIEHGYAVGAGDHRLTVEREGLGPQLGGGRDDGGIAIGSIMAAPVNSRTILPSRRTISR